MRCAVGCGHLQQGADVGYGLDTVRGNAAHPVNRGLACQRGIRESADPDGEWLTQPMVRQEGELRKTTWDVATFHIVEAFRDAMAETRDGVAVLGSGQQTNEAAYALGKLARGGFGTRYYDANTTLCMASAVTAYYDAFGSDAPPCTYDDISQAETHVVWGANRGKRTRWTCSSNPTRPTKRSERSSSTTKRQATGRTARRTGRAFSSTSTAPTPSARRWSNA
jgi:assimilatory nitrate reductase catalytic subunit